ncbi:LacI family DNA-binding transcriptional regulator [Embleya sp. NBC_00896]|uniref:LacI family DNA-binding transcriptional regulator n=1 Tax=Embleya sp. NBC_00896 TaxID=2975961 RepID=UPI002F918EF0|nr:LacI family transcriptional regulator [Embleya sp. NBC_00896]
MSGPTLEDVAARAGVSRSLVSLVMRGSPKVSETRRQAVLAAARELGYRPNLNARTLATGSSSTLGVMISDLHNPYFAEVVDGVEAAANDNDMDIILGTGGRRPAHERRSVERLLQFRPAGLLLLGPVVETSAIEEAASQVPTVLVARSVRAGHVDTVNDDGATGSALAVEHLAALGHRHIVHVDGGAGSQSLVRRRGYEQAMKRLALTRHMRVVPSEYTDTGGAKAARALLGGDELPTAIVAANDFNAVGIIGELSEAGVRVPQDVSVIGYDNTHLAGLRHIGLTTINQPREEMGRLATETLLQRLRGERTKAARHLLHPELVIRTSTGAPRT